MKSVDGLKRPDMKRRRFHRAGRTITDNAEGSYSVFPPTLDVTSPCIAIRSQSAPAMQGAQHTHAPRTFSDLHAGERLRVKCKEAECRVWVWGRRMRAASCPASKRSEQWLRLGSE